MSKSDEYTVGDWVEDVHKVRGKVISVGAWHDGKQTVQYEWYIPEIGYRNRTTFAFDLTRVEQPDDPGSSR